MNNPVNYSAPRRRAMREGTVAAIAVGLAAALALPADAQALRGIVINTEGGEPVPQATLTIVYENGVLGRSVTSNALGRFHLDLPRAGSYRLKVRRIGFSPVETEAHSVQGRDIVDVSVSLSGRAVELERVTTEGRVAPRHVLMDGFENRRRLGLGTFVTREEIVRRGFPTAFDLLRQIPGLQIEGGGNRQTPVVARGLGQANCVPIVYIDAVRQNRANEGAEGARRALESLHGDVIEGIEVYRGRAQLPAEFGSPEVRCGAIVVWTRTPVLERAR